jgi:hypothetical protein
VQGWNIILSRESQIECSGILHCLSPNWYELSRSTSTGRFF